jgi:hypothetical protein
MLFEVGAKDSLLGLRSLELLLLLLLWMSLLDDSRLLDPKPASRLIENMDIMLLVVRAL